MTPAHVATERLVLTAVAREDLRELHAVNADPRLWTHLPSGVYADESRTADDIARYRAEWERDGLGYWTVRRRSDGAFVGIGGVRLVDDAAWNLYYRIAAEHHGYGYATELVLASLAAAAEVNDAVPVVAYLLEHNDASLRTALRSGLTEVWRGPDRQVPGGTRLVLADRPLSAEALAATT